MDLWIRNQDRTNLIKANDIFVCNQVIYVFQGENRVLVAEYKTKERALEVLDEIQNVLKPITIFKNAEISEDTWKEIQKVGVCSINDRADVIKLDTFVYEMPKE